MHFDDRLATVLRSGVAGEHGARTQFRQLLDLLGAMSNEIDGPMFDSAYERLADLSANVPAIEQSRIIREPGQRLRNPRLVAWLAHGEPQAAAAAMATARLEAEQWLALIPRLPVNARGFLRHRRDLPPRVKDLLARLGVQDLVLASPPPPVEPPEAVAAPAEAPTLQEPASLPDEGIRALVRRIEEFRQLRLRPATSSDPRLPLEDIHYPEDAGTGPASLDFATDPTGRIRWAESPFAAMLVGMSLLATGPGALVQLDEAARLAFRQRQPVNGGTIEIHGADPVAGTWMLDAVPRFTGSTGSFAGYSARLRRIQREPAPPSAEVDDPNDRTRQILHELRTPVNAIQGYAEIIQQQLFGNVPNGYRALAAAIAVDVARLLAGFDEIERLARIESGAMRPETGATDFRATLVEMTRRLEGAIRSRNAHFDLSVTGGPFLVELAEEEVAQMCWRLLATLAGALAPGERIEIALVGDGRLLRLEADLPSSLMNREGDFSLAPPKQSQALSAGMFGNGFNLRLLHAEALSAGGFLETGDERIVLQLPVLTGTAGSHSHGLETDRAEPAG